MSHQQWKAYFSMFVLRQTDPIGNPTLYLSQEWNHQSCPWYADVINFKYNTKYYWKDCFSEILREISRFPDIFGYLKHVYTEKEYCHCCGYPSIEYYCDYCEADRCMGCGEMGCGSFMCKPCRSMDHHY